MNIKIAATAQIKFGELWDQGLEDMAYRVLQEVWENSDFSLDDMDAVYLSTCFADQFLGIGTPGAYLRNRLGLAIPVVTIQGGDVAGALAVSRAAQAVESGLYDRVLVLGVEKMSDMLSEDIESALALLLDPEEKFYGQTLAGTYALIARQYMHQYGATLDDLAEISHKNHQNALHNPSAQFQFDLPLDKIKSSPVVASPLRMLDGASFCDGAAALIMEKGDQKGVSLVSTGYASEQLALADRRCITEISSTVQAAKQAYKDASLEPDDIDLAEVHDVFTISELLAMEDLGFCTKGKGADMIRAGSTSLQGDKPINPSGGLKACGHALGATGVRQAVEIVAQLEQRAEGRQVKTAKTGLTHTLSGSGSECVVNIFQNVG